MLGIGEMFGVIVLVADIWAVINVLQSDASTGGKVLWTLGILLFPLLGFVVWVLAGPRKRERWR